MTKRGTFKKRVASGEIKNYANVCFENTGINHPYENDHKIWRKLKQDGRPSNVFAIQFRPNVPWMTGNFFVMIDGGWVIKNYPQLKIETERSRQMTDEQYIEYLSSTYRP